VDAGRYQLLVNGEPMTFYLPAYFSPDIARVKNAGDTNGFIFSKASSTLLDFA